jgi:Protein of unknown function (DUF3349)
MGVVQIDTAAKGQTEVVTVASKNPRLGVLIASASKYIVVGARKYTTTTWQRSIQMNGTAVRSGMLNKVVATALSDVLMRVVGFLRAGYPEGVPAHDYIPLLALLRRRLSDDEVIAIATELISGGNVPVDGTDVRVAITKLTDEMPSPEDTERVMRRMAAVGLPVSDDFGSSD